MHYNTFGSLGWRVSAVGYGAWAIGAERFKDKPGFAATFLPGGRGITGDVLEL